MFVLCSLGYVHSICVEVKGQFAEVSSFYHVGPKAQTQVIRLGSWCPNLLSPLTGPSLWGCLVVCLVVCLIQNLTRWPRLVLN